MSVQVLESYGSDYECYIPSSMKMKERISCTGEINKMCFKMQLNNSVE